MNKWAQLAITKRHAKEAFEGLTHKEARKYLRGLGYEALGRGAFSVVFAHPDRPDYVIRVGRTYAHLTGLGRTNDGFPEYARAIQQGWIRSKNAPRVYALHWNGYSVTVVQRCYKLSKQNKRLAQLVKNTSGTLRGDYLSRHYRDKPQAPRRLRDLLEKINQYGTLDINGSNIMQSASGRLIITDPLTIPV
ncbi:protein kinase protein [Rhizobium phage RHph_TM16]|nr:protein kinase protein [Rhizobium phage RHph_TM16]